MVLNDFAHLMLLLTYNDELQRVLLTSAQTMSLRQLDSGINRLAFWETDVARIYNSNTVAHAIDFSGYLDNVTTTAPCQVQRSGADLRRIFGENSSEFTRSYTRWSASGQNNPSPLCALLQHH